MSSWLSTLSRITLVALKKTFSLHSEIINPKFGGYNILIDIAKLLNFISYSPQYYGAGHPNPSAHGPRLLQGKDSLRSAALRQLIR